jgi:hypothetical protein
MRSGQHFSTKQMWPSMLLGTHRLLQPCEQHCKPDLIMWYASSSTELKKLIDAVGPRFVTQICTDNATNMLGAIDDIVATYLYIFKQGCAAHALDLMLEDWAKIDQFKDLINKASVYAFTCRTTM